MQTYVEFIYLPLILFCISTSITPGPNNLMILLSSVNFGIKRSIPHYLGICFGFTFMLLIIGFGLGELFKTFPYIHKVIKIAGSVYILYLAWKSIFTSIKINSSDHNKRPLTFLSAFLFQWLNPKAWIMAVGVFATFGSENLINQVWIVVIFTIVMFPCGLIWMLGGTVLKFILKNKTHFRIFNISMGLLLVASVVFQIII